MSEEEIARSAPKILGYGGGPWAWWGGTQDFLDGGTGLHGGGTRVRWGGGSPHPPPMSDNPITRHNVITYRLGICCFALSLTLISPRNVQFNPLFSQVITTQCSTQVLIPRMKDKSCFIWDDLTLIFMFCLTFIVEKKQMINWDDGENLTFVMSLVS